MQSTKFRKTKIVATVGPASNSYSKLLELKRAGVNVFRLNFSHGTHEQHLKVINHITYLNNKYNANIGILADLQGPKLRVGKIKNNELSLTEGDIITFTNQVCEGTIEQVYMSYTQFAQDVEVGEKVLLDDGKLQFEVVETNQKDTVKMRVIHGGILSSNKGVNLPDTKISLPSLTEKDLRDLDFILQQKAINWIALSFVRTAEEIDQLRARIKAKNHNAKIIAKVEKPEAVNNIDSIVNASDAVMVARGDLGVEVPINKLPIIQKEIIKKCILKAKSVIVATQMMDSMITNPTPTRAEVTDVANAVFDGTDAVMLSGETSVGRHPDKVVTAMTEIIQEVERMKEIYYKDLSPEESSRTFLSDAICYNACKLSMEVNAEAIVGMTKSGYTAFRVSSYRPACNIFIFSDNMHTLSTLSLVWGTRCFYYDKFTSTDDTIRDVQKILKAEKHIKKGDIVINTGTMPLKARHRTNMLKIERIE